jgi:hypothetical protein
MKPSYVLIWQTPGMAAPAFWYYSSFAVAERMAESFRAEVVWLLKPTSMAVKFA